MNKSINSRVSAASDFNLPFTDVINSVVTKCFLYAFGIRPEQLSLLRISLKYINFYSVTSWLAFYQQFFIFNKASPFIISGRVCQLRTGAFLTPFRYLEQVEHVHTALYFDAVFQAHVPRSDELHHRVERKLERPQRDLERLNDLKLTLSLYWSYHFFPNMIIRLVSTTKRRLVCSVICHEC